MIRLTYRCIVTLGLCALALRPGNASAHAHAHAHTSPEAQPETQADAQEERIQYAAQRNAAGFHPDALSRYRFDRLDEAVMSHIAHEFSIEYREGDRFTVLVPPWRAADFRSLAPAAKLVDEDINPWIYNASYDYLAGYRDYNQVKSTFENWAKTYPNLVALQDFPYMKSKRGKKMIVAKITRDVQKDHPKRPNIVITAATHGDEHLACESLLVNLDKLLKGYSSNKRFKNMIDRANLYIVPVVSPDSFLRSRNVHGVDPNRVYDYPGKKGPQTKLESAVSMIKFYKDIEPVGALDFHGAPPKGMIMYPWGYTSKAIEDAEDRKRHDRVAKAMGKTTPGYAVGPIYSTIYPAKGGTVDHNYMHHDMLAIVIEIGGGQKSPPISRIPAKAREVEEATWIFVESLIPEKGEDDPKDEDSGSEDTGSSSSDGSTDNDSTSGDSSSDKGESDSSSSKDESTGDDDGTNEDSDDGDDNSKDDPENSESDDGDNDEDDDDPKQDPKEDPMTDSKNKKGDSGKGCSLQNPRSPAAIALLGLGCLGWRRRRRA